MLIFSCENQPPILIFNCAKKSFAIRLFWYRTKLGKIYTFWRNGSLVLAWIHDWRPSIYFKEETKSTKKQDSSLFSKLRIFSFVFYSRTQHFHRIHYTLPHLDATHRITTGSDGLICWARTTIKSMFCTTKLLVAWHSFSKEHASKLSTNQILTQPTFWLFQILIQSALHTLLLRSIITITLLAEFWFYCIRHMKMQVTKTASNGNYR